jgi:two-component system, cell cycle sensor histidine kinase and response regulator CckA
LKEGIMQTLNTNASLDKTLPRSYTTSRQAQTPRLLVADDDPAVRDLLARIARRQGWDVTEVADGPTALAAFPVGGAAFDVVILDVCMPGLSGYETYERLVCLHPTARFVFVTGYAADAPLHTLAKNRRVRVLAKPFPVDSFVATVRGLLEG